MSLRRMDIKSVVVGGGPVASLVVLCPQERKVGEGAIKLPIRIGTVEASAISMGVERPEGGRPMTHDLLINAVVALGGKVASVRVTSVSGTTFYAQVELVAANGNHEYLDARPSDAIALAVRTGAPVYAEESVLTTAALPDFAAVEKDEQEAELAEFHQFVESLSPEDFNVPTDGNADGQA